MPFVRGKAKDCMCACVRTFVTCWEVLRAVDQTPAVALHLFNFFWSLFVNLLCGKPEIAGISRVFNRFLLGVFLGQAWLACTSQIGL